MFPKDIEIKEPAGTIGFEPPLFGEYTEIQLLVRGLQIIV